MRLEALTQGPAPYVAPLRAVYEAAARAIDALGDLELLRFEDMPAEGGADLSLFEQVAPYLSSTVATVNALIAEIEVRFPGFFAPPAGAYQQIHQLLNAAGGELKQSISEFGMRARDPAVVGDPWTLVTELQIFRYRVRDRVGVTVHQTAQVLGDCRRPEVDPGYGEELRRALTVRHAATELRRALRDRLGEVANAEAEDIEWHRQQVAKDLEAFGNSPAWRFVRAQDKRRLLTLRRDVVTLGEQKGVKKAELMAVLEPLAELGEELRAINQRPMLIHHDRELSAACGVALERIMSTPDGNLFKRTLTHGRALYGRSDELDGFLSVMAQAGDMSENDMRPASEQFLVLLGSLSL